MSREIDALVAEKVMGSRVAWIKPEHIDRGDGKGMEEGSFEPYPVMTSGDSLIEAPKYSTDIAAAWEVVERMRGEGWSFRFGNNSCAKDQNVASFAQGWRGLGANILTGEYIYDDNSSMVAETAPLAICKAALKAKGIEV
jgi:hypothetical protein